MSIEKTIEVGYGFEVQHTEKNENFSEFLEEMQDNFGIEDMGPFKVTSNIDTWTGKGHKIFLLLQSNSAYLDCQEMVNAEKSFSLQLEQKDIDEAHEYLEKFRGVLEPVHEDIRIHLVCSVH